MTTGTPLCNPLVDEVHVARGRKPRCQKSACTSCKPERADGKHSAPIACFGGGAEAPCPPRRVVFMPTSSGRDGRSAGDLVRLLCLLWLAGVAMRMTLLVMPPVIPQVHDELRMSDTQVGLLIGSVCSGRR